MGASSSIDRRSPPDSSQSTEKGTDMRFASILVGLVSLPLACLAGSLNAVGRPVNDVTLARILGGDSGKLGSGVYGCSELMATNSNGAYISSTDCGTTPNGAIPNPAQQCVQCRNGTNSSGYRNTNATQGDPIYFNQNVNCNGTLWTWRANGGPSYCIAGANGVGTCDGIDTASSTNCSGSFADWNQENPPN
jgi:hypothetical protein